MGPRKLADCIDLCPRHCLHRIGSPSAPLW